MAGGAAGRPAEAGEEPETHCLRRGTSQRELVPTLPRARGRPSAQRPGDLPREEPTRGRPPSRPPSRAPPSGPRAWTRTSGDTEAGAPVSPQASPSPAPLSTPGRCSTPALTGRVAASPGPWGGRSCKTSGPGVGGGASGAAGKEGLLGEVRAAANHSFAPSASSQHLGAADLQTRRPGLSWSQPATCSPPSVALPP